MLTRFLMLLLLLPVPLRAADKLNILLICVDDLKPLLGCYGDPRVKTPNLDRLAARGMVFERAYCNQAVCSPSRNALMTGLRPGTLGIYDLETNFRLARPDAVTLTQHFMAHGWRAEGLGKIYHVGHGNGDDAASWSVVSSPGRAETYQLPASRIAGRPQRAPAGKLAKDEPRGAAWEAADVADEAYRDGVIATEAIARLRAAAAREGTPFFLAAGFIRPHLPFCAPQRWWDLYQRETFVPALRRTLPDGAPSFAGHSSGELRRYSGVPEAGLLPDDLQRTLLHGYHAAVSYVDAQIGRVLDALDALKLTDRTLVVLWGDHGWHLGDHGLWCKHSNYEQAARIPLIVAGPGIKPGRCQGLVESVDIYPTLAELAGLPARDGLDGRSFAAALRDPAAATKPHVLHCYPRGERMGRALRTATHRLVEWKVPGAPADTAELELYDLAADPDETVNLAAKDPARAAALRETLVSSYPESRPPLRVRRGPGNPRAGGE